MYGRAPSVPVIVTLSAVKSKMNVRFYIIILNTLKYHLARSLEDKVDSILKQVVHHTDQSELDGESQ